MRISKFTATALLAIAAMGFTSGAAHADPAQAQVNPADPLALRGSFHEIAYQVTPSTDRRATVAAVQNGRFAVTHDGKIVTLTDESGNVVAAIPMAVHLSGHRVGLLPTVDETGSTLTITPVNEAEAPVRDVDAQERLMGEVQQAMPTILAGAGIGAAIGFLLGFPLGLFIVDVITVPITTVAGAAIGAAIGLAVGGGQPAVDAALAYFDAQP
ncbi:hypothetical protein [Nocardia arthritidis]|uniref:DUF8020 domain-containing protein n=1 Tax=Nocardia arthritidis TaxID=228602 RepID=A0A6G9YSK2_9NOCA|nr:hypothetical protein [Nocardia arthritidis]QIS15986.1 hypothetical protein F5544_40855 [Nocardia arthritidis]